MIYILAFRFKIIFLQDTICNFTFFQGISSTEKVLEKTTVLQNTYRGCFSIFSANSPKFSQTHFMLLVSFYTP